MLFGMMGGNLKVFKSGTVNALPEGKSGIEIDVIASLICFRSSDMAIISVEVVFCGGKIVNNGRYLISGD